MTLDDPGTPLRDVTFCVIDLETTGGSPATSAITEIGAVLLRGGECLGTFQTLVNPGCAIPPKITVLTGITQSMVLPAPRIEAVLGTLLEFIGDAVIVGHNVRFDMSFLQHALERDDRPRLTNRCIDTVALARRLVRSEVPNCRLGTLATHLRLDHRPSHRALDDALTTGDLLHLLIERASSLGVEGLDDLASLPTMAGHAQAGKLRLTEDLPRTPGVYLFRNGRGDVLYVGKATNLRARVRSYFSGDDRRKVGALLRETQRIDHIECPNPLAAAVTEIRLIHEHSPGYNRQSKDWSRYVYVKLTLDETFPRLSIVRRALDDGALYLGPVPSRRQAQRIIDAVHTVIPLRRCAGRVGRTPRRAAPCTAAQLGVSMCPCGGGVDPDEYRRHVERAVRALTVDPELILSPLSERMASLAAQQQFEEALDVRERADALAQTLRRQRSRDRLRRAGRLSLRLDDGTGIELEGGRLARTWTGHELRNPPEDSPAMDIAPLAPLDREDADEVQCIASWFDRNAHRVQLLHCDVPLSTPLPALPSFAPRERQPLDPRATETARRRRSA